MLREIAMILITLAVMAAIQSSAETRFGLHLSSVDTTLELRTGLRS
jgi:hypothetical protein